MKISKALSIVAAGALIPPKKTYAPGSLLVGSPAVVARKLSEAEMEIMEEHPTQGAEKLIQLKEFKRLPLRAIHVALEHHIKEDLSGYVLKSRSPSCSTASSRARTNISAMTPTRCAST